ncbi:MAG: hypothetical protein LBE62_11160 [Azonexus sp.]|jgi:hypothetical protein|nr:hypothetical protein [Azonexus sp.]
MSGILFYLIIILIPLAVLVFDLLPDRKTEAKKRLLKSARRDRFGEALRLMITQGTFGFKDLGMSYRDFGGREIFLFCLFILIVIIAVWLF